MCEWLAIRAARALDEDDVWGTALTETAPVFEVDAFMMAVSVQA